MKYHKTFQNERHSITYKYTLMDEKGSDREYTGVIRPGENGVTEADINLYYKDEDDEVDNNLKNARGKRTEKEKRMMREWRDNYIAEFKAKWGYEPHPEDVKYSMKEAFPMGWSISFDSPENDDIEADKSTALSSASYSEDYEAKIIFEQACGIVKKMKPEYREIFYRIFLDGDSQAEVARAMGYKNRQDVNKRLVIILNRIRKELGVK